MKKHSKIIQKKEEKILWANFKKIRCTNVIRKLIKFAEQNKTKLFVNSNDVIVRMIIAFAVVSIR